MMDNNNRRIQRRRISFLWRTFVPATSVLYICFSFTIVGNMTSTFLPAFSKHFFKFMFISLSLFFLFSCSSCLLHFFPVSALFFIQFYFRFPIFFSTPLSLQPSILFNHSMFLFKILLFILSDWFRFFFFHSDFVSLILMGFNSHQLLLSLHISFLFFFFLNFHTMAERNFKKKTHTKGNAGKYKQSFQLFSNLG